MLYNKNKSEKLDKALFENPTSEYRGTPFWAWNCNLDKDKLMRQIEYLKQMGFGGFHMHTRSGMATEYLGKDFMNLIKACCDKAEDEQMLAWLYDEDRWPSGAAGGIVTKEPKFRIKTLHITNIWNKTAVDKKTGFETGKPYLIACYDVVLSQDGSLESYRRITPDAEPMGNKYYAYVETGKKSGWYNDETYVDTLSEDAMNRFIEVTHEAYRKTVGDKFGKSVPAIFTDEPQFSRKQSLGFAGEKKDVSLPWTTDFAETYKEQYGIDLLDRLPELFWELKDGEISQARYYFHDHVCERFTRAFADNIGAWCDKNGIALTGHMMEEPTLLSQTSALGEAMRAYRGFKIPGIDMLCDRTEYTTAKQAQSAVHQFGYEGMVSELYGVTNWDFDFRGHKFQGDWQAALGVTVRVPHLSWVSMKGSAKRDYPASISYQSPWYKEYPYIEDHYARINTALTRGKPVVSIGVIHPIESYWLHWGPLENTASVRNQLESNFQNITNWLLFGLFDFDFISESLLPSQIKSESKTLDVGCMSYDTVLVPGCETLRSTTLEILEKFAEKGGNLIFVGECPKYVDAKPSDRPAKLYEQSRHISFSQSDLKDALRDRANIQIKESNGSDANCFIYNMRQDNDCKWLFIARGSHTCSKDSAYKNMLVKNDTEIRIKGEYKPEVYDTLSGKIKTVGYTCENGWTKIPYTFYNYDSLLLRLENHAPSTFTPEVSTTETVSVTDIKKPVDYTLEEPNVYILDVAEYALNGGQFKPTEEILRIDAQCRRTLGFPMADGHDTQPWAIQEENASDSITLKFTINSQIDVNGALLAYEEALDITLNGEAVKLSPTGYFTDEDIKTVSLPVIKKGENVLIARVPFSKRISVEYMYILGSFGVELTGADKIITSLPDKIGFSTITSQKLPFYGGNIRYKTEIETPDCSIRIHVSRYAGSLVKVYIDGKDCGRIAFAPYLLTVDGLKAGKHTVEYELFGNRYNTFGPLHNCTQISWAGPWQWYTSGGDWCYEYVTKDTGILASPVIEILK